MRLLALLCLFGLGEAAGCRLVQMLCAEESAQAVRFFTERMEENRRILAVAWCDFRMELLWMLPLFLAGWLGISTVSGAALTGLRGLVAGFGGAFLWSASPPMRHLLFFSLMLPTVFGMLPITLLMTEVSERFYRAQKKETDSTLLRRYCFFYMVGWLVILLMIAGKSVLLGTLLH